VANIRSGPSTQAGILFQVKAGEVLKLLEAKGDWYHVETSAGRRGYLFHSLATERTTPAGTPPPSAPSPASSSAGASSQPGPGLAILHDGVDCVVTGKYTKIEARFDPAERVARARTYFRSAGTSAWYYVEMKPAEGSFVGVLPRTRKNTKSIDYYVQVLDKAFAESRTTEYAPEVVADAGVCSKKSLAAFLPSAKVIVGAPAGGPPIPIGFDAAGIVAEAAPATASGTPGAAAGSEGTGKGGFGGQKALLIGGGVVAAGLVVLVAGGGGGSSAPAGPTFRNARFNPDSVTCSSTIPRNGFFSIDIVVEASNPAGQPLTISAASDVLTYTAVAPNTNSVGENITQASLRFSPAQVPANGSAIIQFQVPLRFSRVDACSGISGVSQLNGQVTIVTSAGNFSAQTTNSLSLVYP
jgi:hypothetical protein